MRFQVGFGVLFVCLAFLVNDCLGDANCACSCAQGCKSQTHWYQIGPIAKFCLCQCVCPPPHFPLPPPAKMPAPPAKTLPTPPAHKPPTPPTQNPYLPPNSSDQVQKCHEAVPGILRCAFELVSSLSNPKFEISADCCSVIKVVEENCMAQAWVPYINLILPLNLQQHCKTG